MIASEKLESIQNQLELALDELKKRSTDKNLMHDYIFDSLFIANGLIAPNHTNERGRFKNCISVNDVSDFIIKKFINKEASKEQCIYEFTILLDLMISSKFYK